jgi:hypothetical protein
VNVRHSAASSLGQIGSPDAVEPLVRALRTEPWLQYPAINALAEIGDPRATPALLELLDDELLRGPVLEALGRLAGREALQRVIPYLYDPDPALRTLAVHAVVAIEQRATAGGESLDPEVQAALRREDLVDHLLATPATTSPDQRTAATTPAAPEPRASASIDLFGEGGFRARTHASCRSATDLEAAPTAWPIRPTRSARRPAA